MSARKPVIIVLMLLLGWWVLGNVSSATFVNNNPAAVILGNVEAIAGPAQVEIRWTTLSELDTAGFNVMRSTSGDGPWERANENAILAQGGDLSGDDYSYVDTGLDGGITYYYYIQELLASGGTKDHTDRTVFATPGYVIYLPIIAG